MIPFYPLIKSIHVTKLVLRELRLEITVLTLLFKEIIDVPISALFYNNVT